MTKDAWAREEKFYLLSGTTLNELLLQHKLLNGVILLTSDWPLDPGWPSDWRMLFEPLCSLYLAIVQCTACIRCSTGDVCRCRGQHRHKQKGKTDEEDEKGEPLYSFNLPK